MSRPTVLDGWIRDEIAPMLRSHGFVGGPRRFRRRSKDGCVIVEFQNSRDSYEGHIKFAVNLGAWNARIGDSEPVAPRRRRPGWADCHVGRRLGDLSEARRERWWVLEGGGTDRSVAIEVREALRSEAIPFLESIETDHGMLRFWESQIKPVADHDRQILSGPDS